ncbi:MAG: HIT domain-containing protein [Candidatus Woesebacteria bacterium]|nr:HIT domain-containing protein [Candidatus Woesebacteria bacterium]
MADYKSTTDKGECIFCKIISGEIKTPGIFWEDDDFMAFLSTWPNMEGVTVFVPKKHYGSDVLEMPDEVLQKMILAAKKVSKNLIKHFNNVGRIGLVIEGTGVDHAHIKLYPMHGTGHMKRGEWKQYLSNNDKFFETYEGYISSNDGPKADEQKIRELAEKLREIK